MDGMGENPSLEDLRALRVVDLKQLLSPLGLSSSGRKEDLVQRLNEHFSRQKGEAFQTEAHQPDEFVKPDVKEDTKDENKDSEEFKVFQESDPIPKPEELPAEPSIHLDFKSKDKFEELKNEEEPSKGPTDFEPKEENEEKKVDPPQGVRLFKKTIQPPKFSSLQPSVPPPAEEFELENLSSHSGGPPPLMSLMVPIPQDDRDYDQRSSVLPKALEDALALNVERANQFGADAADRIRQEATVDQGRRVPSSNVPLVAEADDDEDDEEASKETRDKNARQKRKKKKKRNRAEEWARQAAREEQQLLEEEQEGLRDDKVDIEYVQEKIEMDYSDPLLRQFAKVFETFRMKREADDLNKENLKNEIKEEEKMKPEDFKEELTKVPKLLEADDMIEEVHSDDGDQPKLSKRKLKKMSRLSVAQLKQLVVRPDVVEMHDVTAKDPALLILLKSTRNSVPVPRHWCFKRKYLQGKRGIEKPPFNLPDFIKKTGIMEMRAALQEKEDSKNLKSKMREKVRPKLGKIDIDYQKLHDAFFKWQTKPRLTTHGDLYYEGKEFEIRLKEKKPGDLSDDLRTALGMPVGPNSYKVPPPWLIAMQRYGPPPSYPNLKISGLNAPIPESCSFGYHAGGWGKPPVDESGKPLYGDVFGMADGAFTHQSAPQEVDQSYWGEVESESSEEESEEEEEEEEEEDKTDAGGLQTPLGDAGLATPSGMSSVGMGLGQETPDIIELRKKKIEADMEGGETPSLYTILNEHRNERIGSSMMGSSHTYEIPPLPPGPPASGRGIARPPLPPGPLDSGGVELALNPEEVDLMDTDAMTVRAEAALREKQASLAKEDLSDMVAEHAAKQSNKRKRPQGGGKDDKGTKKYKEFKF